MSRRQRSRLRERLWREWCFYRVVLAHFRVRLLLMLTVLAGGTVSFRYFEPEARHSPERALFYTWQLVFGEAPESFPQSPWLQILFFVVPVLGLTLIVEGIVDFALMLRDRRRNERGWCTMMASSYQKHVVLVGLGRLGFKTYQMLRRVGHPVVVLENSAENQFLEEVRHDGVPLFIGDARQEAMLEEANVREAKSIILATTDDLANLEIALDARRANPDICVVLRMFDQNMADKVREGFKIHAAMSQSAISAPAFAMAAVEPGMVNSLLVEDQVLGMQRWEVRRNGPLSNRTVGGVLAEYECSVIEMTPAKSRSNRQFFPGPDVKLEAGDSILIQGTLDNLDRLKRRAGEG